MTGNRMDIASYIDEEAKAIFISKFCVILQPE